jgi:hypothetical protein
MIKMNAILESVHRDFIRLEKNLSQIMRVLFELVVRATALQAQEGGMSSEEAANMEARRDSSCVIVARFLEGFVR